MSEPQKNYVISTNLSYGWGKVLDLILDKSHVGKEVHPFIITIRAIQNGTPVEDHLVRAALNKILQNNNLYSVETISNTIFPKSLWNPNLKREMLYSRFLKIYPLMKKFDPAGNKYGRYFQRLIDYKDSSHEKSVNQLDYIIETRTKKGNRRRSALQASIINPYCDHTNQRQRGFPCLQQICFTPLSNGKLGITGFYPYQYLIERAYGNYLGLCYLGQFMAHELGLELAEMTCVAGIMGLGKFNKSDPGVCELNTLIKERTEKYGGILSS